MMRTGGCCFSMVCTCIGRSVRAQQTRLGAWRHVQIKRVHGVARGMMLGNIQRLEIVVGRLDFGPFDDAEAQRKKNPLDFGEGLPQQVARAEGADDAGQREIDVVARQRRDLPRPLTRCCAARRASARHAYAARSEPAPRRASVPARRRLQPLIGDAREHAGFAADPGIAQRLPRGFVRRAGGVPIEGVAQFGEQRLDSRGDWSAEACERLPGLYPWRRS